MRIPPVKIELGILNGNRFGLSGGQLVARKTGEIKVAGVNITFAPEGCTKAVYNCRAISGGLTLVLHESGFKFDNRALGRIRCAMRKIVLNPTEESCKHTWPKPCEIQELVLIAEHSITEHFWTTED